MSEHESPRQLGYSMALAQVGVEMVIPIVAGYYIDNWLGTTPWITSFAAVFGFAAGMIHLIVILKQKERDENSDKKPPS